MAEEYTQLLNTFRRMFSMVDAFHFNSKNTEDIYRKFIDIPEDSIVIPITHKGISDHRKKRNYERKLLRIGFIGSEAPYKGLPLLKNIIKRLNSENYVDYLCLCVYGGREGDDDALPNVKFKGRYTSAMLEQIFDEMDLLVVPSICYETFSLVTIEALSYGTCVLVSDRVGAKDIVAKYSSKFIFDTEESLYRLIKELIDNRIILSEYNTKLLSEEWSWSLERHSDAIVAFYDRIPSESYDGLGKYL